MPYSLLILLIGAIMSLFFGLYLLKTLNALIIEKNDSEQASNLILDGIKTFGLRSGSAIIQLILYTSLVLLILSQAFEKPFSWLQIGAFFMGGFAMCISLVFVIGIVPKMIHKIIHKSKGYLTEGLHSQFDTVSMIGFLIVSIVILGAITCYLLLGKHAIIGYLLGIIFSSFFLTIGGSLFKAGSDIGSTLSSELDSHLPHNDVRNPGTLLDISGDYIGNLIGFCADIIGSFAMSIASTLIFAEALMNIRLINEKTATKLIQLPLLIIALSFLASIISYFICKARISNRKYNNFLLEGLYASIIICGVGTYLIIQYLDIHIKSNAIWGGVSHFMPFFAYMVGLIGVIIISFTSEILTSHRYKPSRKLAALAEFGNTLTSISALSSGLMSNALYLIYILSILIGSFFFAGFYGICMASLGMLSATMFIIIINSFNSID